MSSTRRRLANLAVAVVVLPPAILAFGLSVACAWVLFHRTEAGTYDVFED